MDVLLFSVIYLVALVRSISFAFKMELTGDMAGDNATEYLIYRQAMAGKLHLHSADNYTVESCFFSTMLPAIIQRITRIEPGLLFKVFPTFFYSLMPAFVYLIARQYLDTWYSIIASALVFSNVYFLYDSNYGRNGISLGFASGMLWGVLIDNVWVIIPFALAMIMSHYGTTYVMLYALSLTWLVLFFCDQVPPSINIAVITLVTGAYIWHYVIVKRTGTVVKSFVQTSLSTQSETLKHPTAFAIIPGVTKQVETRRPINGFFKLEHRDCTVQAAFGKTLPYMNLAQKIEWGLSWLIVLFLTTGLTIAYHQFSLEYIVLAAAFYSAILLTIAIPHICIFYGAFRVYFTSLIVLAPCFVIGVKTVSESMGLNGYMVAGIILLAYASAVSGILHKLLGINKRK